MNANQIELSGVTRRHFLGRSTVGVGHLALGSLLARDLAAAAKHTSDRTRPLRERSPHFAPKAKRVIFLHMAGSPPQQELLDYKPQLQRHDGELCPESLLRKETFAFIQGRPRMLGTPYRFERSGENGTWVSELLPNLASVIDDVAVVNSMHTDQFNHAPAQLLLYTGAPRFGHAAMGSWVTYGLGTENEDLPGFVVLLSGGTDPSGGKSLWGTGFLPTVFQGVQCRSVGDPILYAGNPAGIDRGVRRRSLDVLKRLNELDLDEFGDPETLTRIAQYELAYRMQVTVPDVMDISRESVATREAYGAEAGKASFANNCLLARRLVERGVRYVQLFDWGWDFHGVSLNTDIIKTLPKKCREVDVPIGALLRDLKRRGLLDETLVVWSGEFGRTSMRENRGGRYGEYIGRDHHPHCFSIWMAGGGIRGGISYGATDELGYRIVENKMSIADLHATILHLMGFDAHEFIYPHQGLDERLIGPTGEGEVQHGLLA